MVEVRFGHDGWHGAIAREATFERILSVSRAAGLVIAGETREAPKLVIGFDRRFLADAFAAEIAAALAALGIESWLITNPVPTPVVSYTITSIGASGGIAVTAGHLGASQIGLKLRGTDGSALPHRMTTAIEDVLDSAANPEPIGPTAKVVETDPVNGYLSALEEIVPVRAIQRAGITVAIDPMYGSSAELLPRLIDGDGSRSVEIRSAHNPLFPGLDAPDPLAANLAQLRRVVTNGGATFGIALSGDGCIVSAIDDQGKYVPGEQVMSLITHYLLDVRRSSGPIGRSVACSTVIERLANLYGAPIHDLSVGYANSAQAVRDYDLMMAADEWGGFIFPRHVPDRDGMLAGLMICAYVVESGNSISELLESLDEVASRLWFDRLWIPLTEEQIDLVAARLNRQEWPAQVAGETVQEVLHTDGVRLDLEGDDWLLVRFDEYDRALQIIAESGDQEKVQELLDAGRHLMLV
jgi:phosphomannomutase